MLCIERETFNFSFKDHHLTYYLLHKSFAQLFVERIQKKKRSKSNS